MTIFLDLVEVFDIFPYIALLENLFRYGIWSSVLDLFKLYLKIKIDDGC